MCPVCMTTTLAWLAAGVTSTGGITTLVVSGLRTRKRQQEGERHGAIESSSCDEHTPDRDAGRMAVCAPGAAREGERSWLAPVTLAPEPAP
jgi:hypothetical protein